MTARSMVCGKADSITAVGRAILPAAAFSGGSTGWKTGRSRLKAGCGQDWPPYSGAYNRKVMQASVETPSPQPLSVLSEDEKMFQATVRRFARTEIAPHVREMDEAGVFRKDIIKQFFELGLMGIEIPEEYGGQGGTYVQCV